ncbi:hypothetical protein ElyMa_001188900 [Elysia marginata]|uniref:Chitin-binding type-2 domain-containing protein n=1 Tax=Elysia marginata TaxID=1093978 RepID=A0AAV4I654_9GAST|nr:hypothetical protein ElyMa_001188900 [Elysia marginata]
MCTGPNCRSCRAQFASCLQQSNGITYWPGRPGTGFWVECRDQRVVAQGDCGEDKVGRKKIFDPDSRKCVMYHDTISEECKNGLPWELLSADDLAIIADSEEELQRRWLKWQIGLESKGLKVNTGKTEVMVSGRNRRSKKATSDKWWTWGSPEGDQEADPEGDGAIWWTETCGNCGWCQKMQTTETFGDDGSGPPTPPWDKAREVK